MKGYKTYVMVLERQTTGDEVHFVTGYDEFALEAFWKKDEYAEPFSEAKAKKICEGLRWNGFNASIVQYPEKEVPPKNHWIQNV